MKRILCLTLVLAASVAAYAQSSVLYYQDSKNVDMLRHRLLDSEKRTEIILPQVNGYTLYKADLHTHTVFSDGNCTPKYRALEAWRDGLDIMAVTEHIEYRPHEKIFQEYMNVEKPDTKDKFTVSDLNLPVREAQNYAKKYGLVIIPGIEITRNPLMVGHYNALFTTDNNIIYDKDPIKAIQNAKAQGALVMHNHPGWRRTSLEMPEVERKAHELGLIDGIETMNGPEFYPKAITRAAEKGLFMAANTDIHATTYSDYHSRGDHFRNMTFILAKDKSLDSIKEALEANRTIAYAYGTLAGEEQLMKDFFLAAVNFTKISNKSAMMTNNSSIDFYIMKGQAGPVRLAAFSSILLGRNEKTGEITISVANIWIPGEKNLKLTIKVN